MAGRVTVRGEARTSSGGGSAGPFNVKEIRRGREDVAVARSLGVVTAFGFSGAAMMGVAGATGVAGVERREGLDGDGDGAGAGAASGTVVVTVVVVTVSGAG